MGGYSSAASFKTVEQSFSQGKTDQESCRLEQIQALKDASTDGRGISQQEVHGRDSQQ